ncbi:NADP oxidoreductase [Kitasatospora acidiphila]|uniref:NADP oxidoreductase n=1 Tax=Kitasatospora acidiphila TaxID=2567942 RepID=A0A540W512_9ACTN|nr:NAD(P)-binding domain-containing protein [Kitasatospora acidiphila]TQF04017.1 NADP oxidoreductase [Kitasatospora acidiphila]
MNIGILGTGSMAATLGGAWVRAGHTVRIGGRSEAAAQATATRIGAAGHGSLAEAARFGELVLLAVPAAAAPELAGRLAAELAGRTVLDCTNALAPGADGLMLATPAGRSVAQQIAAAAPEAHVVKAFNLCHESIWTLDRLEFAGAPLTVPFCADAQPAQQAVSALITTMGCTPLPCGPLSRATYLEATAAFAIGAWWSGAEPRHAFPTPGAAA